MIIPDLNFGGAQTMVIRLIHAIDVSKFEVKLFIRDSKLGNSLEKEAEEKGIECIYLNLGENEKHNLLLVHKCKAYARLSKALKIFDPDLIHSHLEQFYSFLFSIHHGVPLVHTLHSMPERIYTKRLNIMIKALQNKNHLRIVGCSKKTSQKAQELFRFLDIAVLSGSVDAFHFSADFLALHFDTPQFLIVHRRIKEALDTQFPQIVLAVAVALQFIFQIQYSLQALVCIGKAERIVIRNENLLAAEDQLVHHRHEGCLYRFILDKHHGTGIFIIKMC